MPARGLLRRTIGRCRLVYNLCLDQNNLDRERSRPRNVGFRKPEGIGYAVCFTPRGDNRIFYCSCRG